MAAPGAVLEDADLREPLGDEVVVVHPAGPADAAVRHERVPLDAEPDARIRGHGLRRAHLHHGAVARVAVLGEVAQRRREVLLGRGDTRGSGASSAGAGCPRARGAREAHRLHLDPAEAARVPRRVVRRPPSLASGVRREVVTERVPVEVEREARERPAARVVPVQGEAAGDRVQLGIESRVDRVARAAWRNARERRQARSLVADHGWERRRRRFGGRGGAAQGRARQHGEQLGGHRAHRASWGIRTDCGILHAPAATKGRADATSPAGRSR